jgi:hypothetical protein
VRLRELGAAALVDALAQDLGLIDLINAHVPPAPPRRRPSLAVGHSLRLAALHRAVGPKSKRALAAGYQDTVRARLVPASREEWSSPRGGDHLARCEPEHGAPMPRALGHRMHERFPLGAPCLVSDTTHSDPCMPTCHRRPSLPQRGQNQPPRADLRPLSLALVVDEERGLPLYDRGSAGQVTAVVALGTRRHELVGPCLPQPVSPRLPLGRAQGQVARDHCQALPQAHGSFLAALPAGGVRRLSQVSPQASPPLGRPDGRRRKV